VFKAITLLLILIIANSTFAQANSVDDRIRNVQVNTGTENLSLKTLLSKIEDQSDIYFSFENNLANSIGKISFQKSQNTVGEVLDKLSADHNLQFKQTNNTIGVSLGVEKKMKESEKDEWTLNGNVYDGETGETLIGVTIIKEGTVDGAISDIEGNFSMVVEKGDILEVSYVGYVTQKISITNQTFLKIEILPDVEQLEEVVVVGYGVQKKVDVTSSVSVISTDDISVTPYTGVDQIIQNKAAGVQVISGGGLPGSGSAIKIRGVNTWGNTEPLYVIDGVFFNATGGESFNPLSTINPNDIESISILKDASATSIYGSQAAGGVVLITTKRGKEGKSNVRLSSSFSVARPVSFLDVLNAKEYFQVNKDILINAGRTTLPARFRFDSLFIQSDSTDWQDEIFQNGLQQEHNLTVSGGANGNRYLFSLNYSDKEGHVIDSRFQRVGLRANTDFDLGRFRVGESFNFAFVENQLMPGLGVIRNALIIPPYIPLRSEESLDGFGFADQVADQNSSTNPVALAVNNEDFRRDFQMIGNVYGEADIFDFLTFRTSLGFDVTNRHTSQFRFLTQTGTPGESLAPTLRETQEYIFSYLWENTLTYEQTFADLAVKGMVGQTLWEQGGRATQIFADGFINNELQSATLAPVSNVVFNDTRDVSLLSYFGRLNLSYDDKYLVQASFRRDGSSKFGPGNRIANFSAFSVGWRIVEEAFLRDLDYLSELKLRASWGRSGNDRIGDFRFLDAIWTNPSVTYPFGGGGENFAIGATAGVNPGNSLILWETTEQSNFGIDVGLFRGKIQFTAEYFDKTTFDILTEVPVPISLGLGFNGGNRLARPIQNAATVSNTGFDFSGQYQFGKGNWNFSVGGNIGFLNNEVISLGSGEPIEPLFTDIPEGVTRTAIGGAIGSFIGYKVDKVYSTTAEVEADNANAQALGFDFYQNANTSAGDLRFKDLNGDGVINSEDITVLGSPLPDYTYGISINASYKQWSLAISGNGAHGHELYNLTVAQDMDRVRNYSALTLNRWRREGDVTNVPRAIFNDPARNSRGSDRYLEDGSYFRLSTVTLSRSINTNVFSQLMVFGTVQNLLTITDYSGYDPETARGGSGGPGNNLTLGVDSAAIPMPRTYTVGMNITF